MRRLIRNFCPFPNSPQDCVKKRRKEKKISVESECVTINNNKNSIFNIVLIDEQCGVRMNDETEAIMTENNEDRPQITISFFETTAEQSISYDEPMDEDEGEPMDEDEDEPMAEDDPTPELLQYMHGEPFLTVNEVYTYLGGKYELCLSRKAAAALIGVSQSVIIDLMLQDRKLMKEKKLRYISAQGICMAIQKDAML